MSIFTKTTKGKVMGIMLVLAALGALGGAIAFIVSGNVRCAFAAGGMFGSILTVGFGAAGYLREQEWKTQAAERRRNYWNDIAA